jgi:hypothetical protein
MVDFIYVEEMSEMNNKRYTVISVPTHDGPTYRIYDRINQCSIEGGFDTQKWAESVAEMMEEKDREKNDGKTSRKHKRMA